MKTKILYNTLVLIFILSIGCKKDKPIDPQPNKLEVVINDIPYQTEKYLRIGYTLKTWEFSKDGLELQYIVVLDDDSKTELLKIEGTDNLKIYHDPLDEIPFLTPDKISSYYLSIQLPILLGQPIPNKVSHRFIFKDTLQNTEVIVEGGLFSPRKNESPIAISSPVKGTNWLFINQSTLGYHFNAMFFQQGIIGTAERYAFDNLQLNEDQVTHVGDPRINESYFNYKDTLFAVADGAIMLLKDGRPENSGNARDVSINSLDEYGGNYIILNMGNSRFAVYGHCVPNSFLVNQGDNVKEGDPIALLGNSGNSTEPHLHFQICDEQNMFMSKGIPFVIKKYTKMGEAGSFDPFQPTEITNSMMEQFTILKFD
ncbi:MAG: M23 family metallopeptidase [Bacteroidales bacterium]|nr:M23 family metallopeptidase [Bacteroidales bacterium]